MPMKQFNYVHHQRESLEIFINIPNNLTGSHEQSKIQEKLKKSKNPFLVSRQLHERVRQITRNLKEKWLLEGKIVERQTRGQVTSSMTEKSL